MKHVAAILLLLLSLLPPLCLRSDGAERIALDGVEFVWQVPAHYHENSPILILFGGRNWPGEKTLNAYGFDRLADTYGLFLLSPSFIDREYWEPEEWSGQLLLKAVAELERRYRLRPRKLYLYGYSAGGQCANLFYAWMPERVAAWGAHACGVYFTRNIENPVPALISCGTEDTERFAISRQFLYRYREAGGPLLWKPFPAAGHELNREALALASAWFDALLSGRDAAREHGEDDTLLIREDIEPEFRNPLYSAGIRELWRK